MKKINKKRILCFGDSNTWGYVSGSEHQRLDDDIRYPMALQKLLGDNFEIIEEGLNSRTLVSEDARPGKEGRNGSTYLIPCLDSHDPLDLVILMLGTNELKHRFQNAPEQIGKLFETFFVKVILGRKSQFKDTYPQLLIISLPNINESAEYAAEKFIGGAEKVKEVNTIYQQIAEEHNCQFVDASNLEIGQDGIHLTEKSHLELAGRLFDKIKTHNN